MGRAQRSSTGSRQSNDTLVVPSVVGDVVHVDPPLDASNSTTSAICKDETFL